MSLRRSEQSLQKLITKFQVAGMASLRVKVLLDSTELQFREALKRPNRLWQVLRVNMVSMEALHALRITMNLAEGAIRGQLLDPSRPSDMQLVPRPLAPPGAPGLGATQPTCPGTIFLGAPMVVPPAGGGGAPALAPQHRHMLPGVQNLGAPGLHTPLYAASINTSAYGPQHWPLLATGLALPGAPSQQHGHMVSDVQSLGAPGLDTSPYAAQACASAPAVGPRQRMTMGFAPPVASGQQHRIMPPGVPFLGAPEQNMTSHAAPACTSAPGLGLRPQTAMGPASPGAPGWVTNHHHAHMFGAPSDTWDVQPTWGSAGNVRPPAGQFEHSCGPAGARINLCVSGAGAAGWTQQARTPQGPQSQGTGPGSNPTSQMTHPAGTTGSRIGGGNFAGGGLVPLDGTVRSDPETMRPRRDRDLAGVGRSRYGGSRRGRDRSRGRRRTTRRSRSRRRGRSVRSQRRPPRETPAVVMETRAHPTVPMERTMSVPEPSQRRPPRETPADDPLMDSRAHPTVPMERTMSVPEPSRRRPPREMPADDLPMDSRAHLTVRTMSVPGPGPLPSAVASVGPPAGFFLAGLPPRLGAQTMQDILRSLSRHAPSFAPLLDGISVRFLPGPRRNKAAFLAHAAFAAGTAASNIWAELTAARGREASQHTIETPTGPVRLELARGARRRAGAQPASRSVTGDAESGGLAGLRGQRRQRRTWRLQQLRRELPSVLLRTIAKRRSLLPPRLRRQCRLRPV